LPPKGKQSVHTFDPSTSGPAFMASRK
jgi:hypothetical protein